MTLGSLAAAAWLAGCGGPPAGVDEDGDGFPLPRDCDDTDPRIHPHNADDPYDAVDTNCDGVDSYDADGDGYPAWGFGGTDCDDADPGANPGTPRVCGNGVDDDCDFAPDCDLRGRVVLEDVVAAWFSGPPDSATGSALALGDHDADGTVDLLPASGDLDQSWLFHGSLLDPRRFDEADGQYFGGSAGVAQGDLDGDGLCDVATATELFGLPSGARLWYSPTTSAAPPDAWLDTSGGEDLLSVDIAPDIDGDAIGDLLLGVWGHTNGYIIFSAAFLVFSGPVAGTFTGDVANAVWIDDDDGSHTVQADLASDLTGDGLVDLVVGSWPNKVYLITAPFPPVSGTAAAQAIVEHMPDDGAGDRLIGADLGSGLSTGDIDGDGLADAVVALDSGQPGGIGVAGEVWVLRSPLEGTVGRSDALAIVEGVNAPTTAVAGDIDGDGQVDLILTNWGTEDGIVDAEIAYAPRGVVVPEAVLHPAAPDDSVFHGVAAPGDVDGDGLADLLAATPGSDIGAPGGGAVQLILGLPTGY